MAEVLGVAAGAAGLAGVVLQVFDSANRLRQFCSSVKNVPEDLDILLDEISVFSTVIADCAREEQQQEASTLSSTSTVTKQEQPPSYQSPFTRANEYCRQAATQLETVLGDSYDSCQKKGVRQVLASVKFVFREKEVKKGLQRLERAKSLLSLAQQCLLQSKINRLAATQAQEFEAVKQLLSPSQTIERLSESSEAQKKQSSGKGKIVQNSYWILVGTLLVVSPHSGSDFPSVTKFHSALWTSLSLGFEVLCQRSFGRPSYTFRSYNVISRTDEVWKACVIGDLERMESLFARGQASPYDSTEDGATLLHAAATFHQANVCKRLLDYGVDQHAQLTLKDDDHSQKSDRTPIMMATGFSSSFKTSYSNSAMYQREWIPVKYLFGKDKWTPNSQKALDTMRVLVERGSADPILSTQFDDRAETAISLFDLDAGAPAIGVLEYLLNQVSISEFHELADSLMWPYSHKTTLAGATLMSHLARLACATQDPKCLHRSLLCLVNRLNSLCTYDKRTWEEFLQCRAGRDRFRESLNSLIDAGVDLHQGIRRLQPLRLLTKPSKKISETVDRRINELIQIWLQWLKDCQVDLHSYLREEHDLHRDNTSWSFIFTKNFWQKTKKSGSRKVQLEVETHLLFDFTQTDLTSSLSVRHQMLHDSRRQTGQVKEMRDLPGSWID